MPTLAQPPYHNIKEPNFCTKSKLEEINYERIKELSRKNQRPRTDSTRSGSIPNFEKMTHKLNVDQCKTRQESPLYTPKNCQDWSRRSHTMARVEPQLKKLRNKYLEDQYKREIDILTEQARSKFRGTPKRSRPLSYAFDRKFRDCRFPVQHKTICTYRVSAHRSLGAIFNSEKPNIFKTINVNTLVSSLKFCKDKSSLAHLGNPTNRDYCQNLPTKYKILDRRYPLVGKYNFKTIDLSGNSTLFVSTSGNNHYSTIAFREVENKNYKKSHTRKPVEERSPHKIMHYFEGNEKIGDSKLRRRSQRMIIERKLMIDKKSLSNQKVKNKISDKLNKIVKTGLKKSLIPWGKSKYSTKKEPVQTLCSSSEEKVTCVKKYDSENILKNIYCVCKRTKSSSYPYRKLENSKHFYLKTDEKINNVITDNGKQSSLRSYISSKADDARYNSYEPRTQGRDMNCPTKERKISENGFKIDFHERDTSKTIIENRKDDRLVLRDTRYNKEYTKSDSPSTSMTKNYSRSHKSKRDRSISTISINQENTKGNQEKNVKTEDNESHDEQAKSGKDNPLNKEESPKSERTSEVETVWVEATSSAEIKEEFFDCL